MSKCLIKTSINDVYTHASLNVRSRLSAQHGDEINICVLRLALRKLNGMHCLNSKDIVVQPVAVIPQGVQVLERMVVGIRIIIPRMLKAILNLFVEYCVTGAISLPISVIRQQRYALSQIIWKETNELWL